MLGKWRMTTSKACMASNGICLELPSIASSRENRQTWATHFIATLKTLSLPSPGSVTSNSTCSVIQIGVSLSDTIVRGVEMTKLCTYWSQVKHNFFNYPKIIRYEKYILEHYYLLWRFYGKNISPVRMILRCQTSQPWDFHTPDYKTDNITTKELVAINERINHLDRCYW